MQQHIISFTPDGSSSKNLSLSLWETVMRQALAAARNAQIVSALAGYQRALSLAHQLIEAPAPARAEDCVAALVVSYHNLADLTAEHGGPDAAASHLCRAHEALIALFLDAERDAGLRQAALRHSRETHVALISHMARHGPHPLVTRALRSGCLALDVGSLTRH